VHVGQQVVHGPAQQFLVADGDEPGGDAGLPGSPRIGDPGPLDAAGGQRADIDRLVLPGRSMSSTSRPIR
jgi:hypothetical protein